VIDAEIAGKGHLWMGISFDKPNGRNCKCVIDFTILGKNLPDFCAVRFAHKK
jgi:hypothetical protein